MAAYDSQFPFRLPAGCVYPIMRTGMSRLAKPAGDIADENSGRNGKCRQDERRFTGEFRHVQQYCSPSRRNSVLR
jgi:hypothetical protein